MAGRTRRQFVELVNPALGYRRSPMCGTPPAATPLPSPCLGAGRISTHSAGPVVPRSPRSSPLTAATANRPGGLNGSVTRRLARRRAGLDRGPRADLRRRDQRLVGRRHPVPDRQGRRRPHRAEPLHVVLGAHRIAVTNPPLMALRKSGQMPFLATVREQTRSRSFKPPCCGLAAAGLSGTAVHDSAGRRARMRRRAAGPMFAPEPADVALVAGLSGSRSEARRPKGEGNLLSISRVVGCQA